MPESLVKNFQKEVNTVTDDKTDTELVNNLADLGTPHWLVMEIEERLAAAVRRVAPDRETPQYAAQPDLHSDDDEWIVWPLDEFGSPDGDPFAVTVGRENAETIANALNSAPLASGVLGVPAEQPWADADRFQFHVAFENDASNLIRAEALEAAADGIQALHPGEVKASVEWLRARAAEYRKKAGG